MTCPDCGADVDFWTVEAAGACPECDTTLPELFRIAHDEAIEDGERDDPYAIST